MNVFLAFIGGSLALAIGCGALVLLEEIAKALRAIDDTLSSMDLFEPDDGPGPVDRIAAALEAQAGKPSPWARPAPQASEPGDLA